MNQKLIIGHIKIEMQFKNEKMKKKIYEEKEAKLLKLKSRI